MRESSTQECWCRRLEQELREVRKRPNVPLGDIEWLLLRCADTAQMPDGLREASVVDLKESVREFIEEYPGLVSPDVASEAI